MLAVGGDRPTAPWVARDGAALAPLPPVTLVTGGARSGKSALAEAMVAAAAAHLGIAPIYFATAEAGDAEMSERIAHHQARRGPHWLTVEEALELPRTLAALPPGAPVLIDCLTLWLSNLMLAGRDCGAAADALLAALAGPSGPVVLVGNEVGGGIVPENALARAFRDYAGILNQRVAAAADRVVLVTSGIALVIKDNHDK